MVLFSKHLFLDIHISSLKKISNLPIFNQVLSLISINFIYFYIKTFVKCIITQNILFNRLTRSPLLPYRKCLVWYNLICFVFIFSALSLESAFFIRLILWLLPSGQQGHIHWQSTCLTCVKLGVRELDPLIPGTSTRS